MLDMQGNTSYGNSQLLLQTKLVSILERLVEKTALEGAQDGADEVTKLTKPTTSDETGLEGAQDDASHLSKLRVSSLTLLLALLEGSTTQSHQEKMLRVLDLGALARSVAKSYERSVSLADEAPTKTLDMETAELHYVPPPLPLEPQGRGFGRLARRPGRLARRPGRLARRPGRLRPGWCGDPLGIPTPLCPVCLCL
jgi:hypothetical protein